jgi:hypothetical protein
MKGWSRKFEDPVTLPDGRELVTLKQAADFVMALPKAEQAHEKWLVAIKVLIMAAEGRGPLMHARIGIMRALHRNVERVFTDRKDHHWESGSWRGTGNKGEWDCLVQCCRVALHLGFQALVPLSSSPV